eukprot:gnl/MRDRNA2_/MRDRNA2_66774_c0_seq1.p2 gnl/MRDRNA2_/MRDRNA2_66774_c0~~gnl/MRDRNA2_/MRDRNA2_66774_c0_seq1.p2  ORF type:complete len:162 (+),score=33.71 gnl/MRDRNA2_/MRDRNA2_66774_c0_seq1:432-917(+)
MVSRHALSTPVRDNIPDCPGASNPIKIIYEQQFQQQPTCQRGLKIKPEQGNAVMWYNYHPNGREDENSLHEACCVGQGLTKWAANKWVKIKPETDKGMWIEDHPSLQRAGYKGNVEDKDEENRKGKGKLKGKGKFKEKGKMKRKMKSKMKENSNFVDKQEL